MEQKCSCGNKYFVLLSHLSSDEKLVAEPCEPPTAICPGCNALWQQRGTQWEKVFSASPLQALRRLSGEMMP